MSIQMITKNLIVYVNLNSLLLYQSEVFLHTGDAADDFYANKQPKCGDQCSNDFTIFNRII